MIDIDVELMRAVGKLKNEKFKSWIMMYFVEHKDRIKSDFEYIQKNTDSKLVKILDVGSLPGILLFFLKKSNYNVTGLDLAPDRAREFIKQNQLNIVRCDIEVEDFPVKNGLYDFVIFNETFEHLRVNPVFTLNQIYKSMKSGGQLMLTTPNLYSLRNIFRFMTGRGINDPLFEFKKLEKYGHMGHIREYSAKEIKKFLESVGFHSVEIQYKFYAPIGKTPKSILKYLLYNIFIKNKPFLMVNAIK